MAGLASAETPVIAAAEASVRELLAALPCGEAPDTLEVLRALRQRLPDAAEAIRLAAHRICPLACDMDEDVAQEAAQLLELVAPKQAEVAEAEVRKVFIHGGVEVEYWDLAPTDDHLLFGYAVWPVAELLAKLLMNRCTVEDLDADMRAAVPAVPQQSVLEIGAGVGLTGLACHAMGARRVLLTDGEERLVLALEQKHGHLEGVAAALLDWTAEQGGGEQFDVVLGSDILLTVCQGHIYAPRVVAARLRRTPEARGLLVAPVRNAGGAQEVAAQELEKLGLCVELFLVSAAVTLLKISRARLPTLAHGAVVLITAQWPAESRDQVEEVAEHGEIDDDLAELLQLED